MSSSVSVRRVHPEDVSQTFALIDAENWGLQWEKYSLVYQATPDSFFLLENSQSRQILATVCFVEVLPGILELGYMVVHKDHRAQGHGSRLVKEALKMLQYSDISVTIAPGTGKFYRSLGMQRNDNLSSHMFQKMVFDRKRLDNKMSCMEKDLKSNTANVAFRRYQSKDFDDLVDYVNSERVSDDRVYMTVLVRFADIFLAEDKDSGKIAGFIAVSHTKGNPVSMDGLYADSDWVALMLFREVLLEYPTDQVFMVHTLESRPLFRHVGEAFFTMICYKFSKSGTIPKVPTGKLYVPFDTDFSH